MFLSQKGTLVLLKILLLLQYLHVSLSTGSQFLKDGGLFNLIFFQEPVVLSGEPLSSIDF